jgi:hypothetical protein
MLMTPANKILRITAIILLGLYGGYWIIMSLTSPYYYYTLVPIILLGTAGMMFLVWKRPFIAGILLLGLTLLLIWLTSSALQLLMSFNQQSGSWFYLEFYSKIIGPLLLASLLLLATRLVRPKRVEPVETPKE